MKHWQKHFDVVDQPDSGADLLAVGPDVIELGLHAPAKKRYLTTYPGFGHNPLHNFAGRARDLRLLPKYTRIFINPGPLEMAYANLSNVTTHPISIDVDAVPFRRRSHLESLLHASNDSPQKDWQRSLAVMTSTGLKHEVFPRRIETATQRNLLRVKIRARGLLGIRRALPSGYAEHGRLHARMLRYDGFVHSASDVASQQHLDGKYTATLIEAGLSGALLFWHDTFRLGNDYSTIFSVPLDPALAALDVMEVARSVDISKHSSQTREELAEACSAAQSVAVRAEIMHTVAEST